MGEYIDNNIKKGKSFNDFQNLELKGKVKYIPYGEFLSKKKRNNKTK